MHADNPEKAAELRVLLRALRGERLQREVAKAAGVSLSFYKKLEGGHARGAQLRNLVNVARALGAGDDERAALIRLARPDLARMLRPEGLDASVETSLRSLQSFATGLGRTKGSRDAVRFAVELLCAALGQEHVAFALERRPSGTVSYIASSGDPSAGFAWEDIAIPPHHAPGAGPHVLELDAVRITCVSIRGRGRFSAVLGLASGRSRGLDQTCALFLETVAAMLEMSLTGYAPSGST